MNWLVASSPIHIGCLTGGFNECGVSLTANIGVVIGLGVVIFEINQNTEMMQSQINQSRTDTAISEQQALFNSDFMPALVVKINNGEQLSDSELVRFEAFFFRAFNRNMDNQLWQYNQGFLEENVPRSIKGASRIVIAGNSQRLELGIARNIATRTSTCRL